MDIKWSRLCYQNRRVIFIASRFSIDWSIINLRHDSQLKAIKVVDCTLKKKRKGK